MRFLSALTTEHLETLAEARVICLDIETTGLTLFAPECRVGKRTKIGGAAFSAYTERFPFATVDTGLRARVLSVSLEGDRDRVMAWDLDALTPEARRALVEAVIGGKIVAGANLAFDLSWLSHYAPGVRPAGILDTHILVRTERPAIAQVGLAYRATSASRDAIAERASKMVSGRKSGASLEAMALYFELDGCEEIDKRYQRPENWSVSPLSDEHYKYATGDVEIPVDVCRRILRMSEGASALEIYEAAVASPHYQRAMAAVFRLVDMHASGMPFDAEVCETMRVEAFQQITESATRLLEAFPELGPHKETLYTAKQSVPQALKGALADCLEARGVDLRGTDGAVVIDKKGAILAGAGDVPGWQYWAELQDAKKRLTMLSEYQDLARNSVRSAGGRCVEGPTIHSLIGINAATMRTSSQYPNIQNVPGCLRSVYAAPEGKVIIAADYSQIELRIAAALAARAYHEALDRPHHGEQAAPKWVREAIAAARMSGREHPAPERAPHDIEDPQARMQGYLDSYKHTLTRAVLRIRRVGMPLVDVFRKGLDPHLATGLAMLERQGGWERPEGFETIPAYLASLTDEEAAGMKAEYATARKAAKAVNFGLLYGMQAPKLWRTGVVDYGLAWTEEDAAAARDAWLEAYPEVAFWQVWTRVVNKMPGCPRMELAAPAKGGGTYNEERTIWSVKTLTGRTCVADSMTKALNFQDQGSGADMVLSALPLIPDDHRGRLVNLVHDEIVAVAEAEHAESYAETIKAAMIAAGDEALAAYGIPVEVEYGIGAWDH